MWGVGVWGVGEVAGSVSLMPCTSCDHHHHLHHNLHLYLCIPLPILPESCNKTNDGQVCVRGDSAPSSIKRVFGAPPLRLFSSVSPGPPSQPVRNPGLREGEKAAVLFVPLTELQVSCCSCWSFSVDLWSTAADKSKVWLFFIVFATARIFAMNMWVTYGSTVYFRYGSISLTCGME